MSKDIKKALEHCVEWNCDNCPNREELGSGEIVCRGRLLPEVLEYVADLEAKLAESEKKVKHWHNLYNVRDKQFQSVRQRYHLLNKLQSNYDKKDKLHLAYMQCAELVDENEQLKQQLAEKDREIEYQENMKILAVENQNKKAIEQLEKVKEKFGYKHNSQLVISSKHLVEFIDQQINVLRNNKDGIY